MTTRTATPPTASACAGLLLGVVEALAGLALPEGAKEVVPYLLLLVALLLLPSGLGGWLRRRG